MVSLTSFTSVSLDGYYCSPTGDMSWAHADPTDAEWQAFVSGNAGGDSALVFGRVTYALMASYWPTPMAQAQQGAVAAHMNRLQKITYSRTLNAVSWTNTTLVRDDLVGDMRARKSNGAQDMVILGSGSIVAQLADAGLINRMQLVVVPVILGAGKSPFSGVTGPRRMQHTGTRTFGNGNVVLDYQPMA